MCVAQLLQGQGTLQYPQEVLVRLPWTRGSCVGPQRKEVERGHRANVIDKWLVLSAVHARPKRRYSGQPPHAHNASEFLRPGMRPGEQVGHPPGVRDGDGASW